MSKSKKKSLTRLKYFYFATYFVVVVSKSCMILSECLILDLLSNRRLTSEV